MAKWLLITVAVPWTIGMLLGAATSILAPNIKLPTGINPLHPIQWLITALAACTITLSATYRRELRVNWNRSGTIFYALVNAAIFVYVGIYIGAALIEISKHT